jgi:hypothetical protein
MGNAAQTKPAQGGGSAAGGAGSESKSETVDPNDAGYVWGELQSQNQELPNNIELRLNHITIGRRKDNTFSISGPLISGHHCVITRKVYEGTDAIEVFHIIDESQNGTFLDGVSIGKGNKKVLRHGATVALPWRVTKDNGQTEDKLISTYHGRKRRVCRRTTATARLHVAAVCSAVDKARAQRAVCWYACECQSVGRSVWGRVGSPAASPRLGLFEHTRVRDCGCPLLSLHGPLSPRQTLNS